MGRHAIVAATSPMIKTDAVITDDDATLNALSRGEGAEYSIPLSSLLSLSSDASLLNLHLKERENITNPYREKSLPCCIYLVRQKTTLH